MTNKNDNLNTPNEPGPPPNDQLDAMLRTWHEENAQQAALGRDRLVRALAEQAHDDEYVLKLQASHAETAPKTTSRQSPFTLLRNIAMNPYSRLAASLIILVALVTLFIPTPGSTAYAQAGIIMLPEGGKLEAFDVDGNLIGPCPLKHTDVDVEISGLFSRVTIKQTYQNPYQSKIEAQYTFPMSSRAAVDRMTMTVGDRVVIGEVKERGEARRIYEAARAQNYVASLLEQERPNIFTQSVANIEPQAQVVVEISYVEVLESKDGEFTFDFPMVVGPRYIPGSSMTSPSIVPAELTARHGITLRGPATLTVGAAGDVEKLGSLQTGKLNTLLSSAQPIAYPGNTWWGKGDPTGGAMQPIIWYRFEAEYTDKSKEFGQLYTDGTGQINGRWFYTDPASIKDMGTGFSKNTNQVPDASRITPEPVKPGKRAGHNISLKITIDTGGPGIINLKSVQHKIDGGKFVNNLDEPPSKVTIALANDKEIPNRDFVLNWKTSSNVIQEAKLTHAGENGGFFTLILQPPDRVEDADVGPRELIFVMDTSGSMSGYPIKKSKEVINKAIDAMRDGDTFNIITFANSTSVLWSEPKPATAAYRAEAQAFITSRSGGGGTEMMTAINKALEQNNAERIIWKPADDPTPLLPDELTKLPADGRPVVLHLSMSDISRSSNSKSVKLSGGSTFALNGWRGMPGIGNPKHMHHQITGIWDTIEGKPTLIVKHEMSIRTKGIFVGFLTPEEMSQLIPDGRTVYLRVPKSRLLTTSIRKPSGNVRVNSIKLANGKVIYIDKLPKSLIDKPIDEYFLRGQWTTKDLLGNSDLYFKISSPVGGSDNSDGTLTPTELSNLPADGRSVIVDIPMTALQVAGEGRMRIVVRKDLVIEAILQAELPTVLQPEGVTVRTTGSWETHDGKRVLVIKFAKARLGKPEFTAKPMRIVLFLTDGYVGNDMAIIDAVKNNAHTTRVFSFGIGNSVNRWLLQGMANAGRGEAEFVLLESDSDEAVSRFSRRIQTPVLTDIKLAFSDGLEVMDVIPPLDAVPDLFDVKPLIIHGRYSKAGTGTLTIAGNTGAGKYERTIDLEFSLDNKEHDVISTLWARARVEQILSKDLKAAQNNRFPADLTQQIVALGEEFQIMTQFTSFVAVEKSRITVGGKPVLVAVPIEMPSGVSYEGIFGSVLQNAIFGEQLRARTHYLGRALARWTDSSDIAREKMIHENLARVMELQQELKYREALQVVDEILFIDELNPAARALKEVISTTMQYREWDAKQIHKNLSYAELQRMGRERMIAPVINFIEPGPRSKDAIMAYPEDWPERSIAGLNLDGDGFDDKFQYLYANMAEESRNLMREQLKQARSTADRRTAMISGPGVRSNVGIEIGGLSSSNKASKSAPSNTFTGQVTLPKQAAPVSQSLRSAFRLSKQTAGKKGAAHSEGLGIQAGQTNLNSLKNRGKYYASVEDYEMNKSKPSLMIKDGKVVPRTAGKKGVASGESLGVQPGRRMRSRGAPANTPAPAREAAPAAGFGGGAGSGGNKTPPGALPPAASERAIQQWVDQRRSYERNLSKSQLNANNIANDEKGGNITIPWQQMGEAAENEGWYRYDTSRSKSMRSGAVPLLGDIPVIGDALFFKNNTLRQRQLAIDPNGKLGDLFDSNGLLLNPETFSKPEDNNGATFGAPVGGRANVYYELKDLAEKGKVANAAVKADAPPADASSAGAGALPPSSTAKPATSKNKPAKPEEIVEADDKDKIELRTDEAIDMLETHKKEQSGVQTSSEQIEMPLLTHLFNRAGRPMLANEVAIIIGQFAGADELVVASQITDELVEYLPDYEYGSKMRDTFNNEALDDAQKKQAVLKIATQAYNELNEIMFAAYIEARLQNVLEDSLYQELVVLPLDDDRSEDRTARSDDASEEEPLLVSVLLANIDDEVINSLKEIGLSIVARPKGSSFVVGEIQADKLAHLAIFESVRWIEPAKITKQ